MLRFRISTLVATDHKSGYLEDTFYRIHLEDEEDKRRRRNRRSEHKLNNNNRMMINITKIKKK